MDTIELTCPGCADTLAIDSGFAGGVCRCSNCGTLMTVPADPAHEKAEKLTRPDRPDMPGGAPSPRRPEAPTSAAPAPDEAAAPAAPSDAAPSPAAAPGEEVFTTASGKTIRVKVNLVPIARKHKRAIIKGSIVFAFVAVVVVLIGVAIAAIAIMTRDSNGKPDTPTQGIGWSAENNPFRMLSVPHVAGVLLEYKAAVVIDAGVAPWLGDAKAAVAKGIANASDLYRLQVVFATADGAKAVPEAGLALLTEAGREELVKAMADVKAGGNAKLDVAVARAVASEPDQVVLITTQALEPDEVDALSAALEQWPVRFDVIMFNKDNDALSALARRYNGRLLSLPREQLQVWLEDAE